MSLKKDVNSVLQQYAMETGVYSVQKVESDFVEVAQQMPAEQVTSGLCDAIRSGQTPPFDQMVGQSFEQGDPMQRASMLNRLLDGAGPAVVQRLIDSGALTDTLHSGDPGEPAVTPELAGGIHPEVAQQVAQQAEQENPAVIEKMSGFYAEDPALVTTLGGGTLSAVLGKMAERQ